jgi:hypothetical protein
MTPMRTTQEIVNSIDARLRELSDEIKTLNTARSALERRDSESARRAAPARSGRRRASSGASPLGRASGKSRTSRASGKSRTSRASGKSRTSRASGARARTTAANASRPATRRVSKAPSADQLELLLSQNGGLSTSELAAQANANRDQVLGLLRDLETAGRIRRTGQRRGTRWHVITDEDRIRERAAELEATRRRAA